MCRYLSTTRELVLANADKFWKIPFLNFYDDIVSFMMGNSPSYFYVLLGVQKIGAVSGPVSCWWQAEEVLSW